MFLKIRPIKPRSQVHRCFSTTSQIRDNFLNYFQTHGYKRVSSDSLVPSNDPSLLFSSAGMVQFKEYFLGTSIPSVDMTKATTVQKCLRLNDIENVGKTARHHTFFEMLGFFSFGSASKEEAIDLAWKFLTTDLQLPKERLQVTVHESDQEAFRIWHSKHGLPLSKIRLGREDNFWAMGDERTVGPCGPCSEIFYDQQQADSDGERWLEIWNLVFMEFERTQDGSLKKLPKPCIDTGMGLERIASVVQGKKTNFDIDLFQSLIFGIREAILKVNAHQNISSKEETYFKIIADHLRAATFLISDGVVPSNIGRGYVLRRIIRRAVNCLHKMNIKDPLLSRMVPLVLDCMGAAYPELLNRKEAVVQILFHEETAFQQLLTKGMKLLKQELISAAANQSKQFPAATVFQLHDTFGFPVDLTMDIIHEESTLNTDKSQVDKLLESQREKARASLKNSTTFPSQIKMWKTDNCFPRFTGYTSENEDATVKAISASDDPSTLWISIDPCPFYPNGGGQVGDKGKIITQSGLEFTVVDTICPYEGGIALKIEDDETKIESVKIRGQLSVGSQVTAIVNSELRDGCKNNHTATHLLHSALIRILKSPIMQAGSLVASDRLRFDFTYGKQLEQEQLQAIEDFVNGMIEKRTPLITRVIPLQEAKSDQEILYLPGEKYQEVVRVVEVAGCSKELCGGTHVSNTGDLRVFKIIGERSISSGTRRIEALTGKHAISWYATQYQSMIRVAKMLGVQTSFVVSAVEKLNQELQDAQKKVRQLSSSSLKEATFTGSYNSHKVVLHFMDIQHDHKLLKNQAELYVKKEPCIHVLVSDLSILCIVGTTENTHAGSLLKEILVVVGGSGGGKQQIAQGQLIQGYDLNKIKSFFNAQNT